MLAGHEPYPALAVDRHWNLVDANDAVPLLTATAAPYLLESLVTADAATATALRERYPPQAHRSVYATGEDF